MMINHMATPMPRAHRLPSLEPYDPRSGTTGVPPSFTSQLYRSQRRPEPPVPEADDEVRPIMDEQLEMAELIQSIEGVMKGYRGYQSRSSMYNQILRDFLARAKELQLLINTPSSVQVSPCPEMVDHDSSPSPSAAGSCNDSPRSPDPFSATYIALQQLLDDWWSSEVAAAWYGPGRRRRSGGSSKSAISALTPVTPPLPATPSQSINAYPKDDGFYRPRAQTRGSGGSRRDHSPGPARSNYAERDRHGEDVKALKRDLSFVRLHDD